MGAYATVYSVLQYIYKRSSFIFTMKYNFQLLTGPIHKVRSFVTMPLVCLGHGVPSRPNLTVVSLVSISLLTSEDLHIYNYWEDWNALFHYNLVQAS